MLRLLGAMAALLAVTVVSGVGANVTPSQPRSLRSAVNIPANSGSLRVSGRTKASDGNSLHIDWIGTMFEMLISQTTTLEVVMVELTYNKYVVEVDGVQSGSIEVRASDSSDTYLLLEDLNPAQEYHVRFVKVTEPGANNGQVLRTQNHATVYGFIADPGFQLTALPEYERRIEFIGDGVTNGYGITATALAQCGVNFGYDVSDFTQAWAYRLCKLLQAECRYISWVDRGIWHNRDNTGEVDDNTINRIFQRTLATWTEKDFDPNTWRPHVVLFASGLVDRNMERGRENRGAWRDKVVEFSTALLSWYRSVSGRFVLVTLPGPDDHHLRQDSEEVYQRMDHDRLTLWDLRPTAPTYTACTYDYPDVATHTAMLEVGLPELARATGGVLSAPSPSPSPTLSPPPTPSRTPSTSRTPSLTVTPSAGASPSATPVPSPSPSPAPSPSPSASPCACSCANTDCCTAVALSTLGACSGGNVHVGDGHNGGDGSGSGNDSANTGVVVAVVVVATVALVGVAAGLFVRRRQKQASAAKAGGPHGGGGGAAAEMDASGGSDDLEGARQWEAIATDSNEASVASSSSKAARREARRAKRAARKAAKAGKAAGNSGEEVAARGRKRGKSKSRGKSAGRSRKSKSRGPPGETKEERRARRAARRAAKAAKAAAAASLDGRPVAPMDHDFRQARHRVHNMPVIAGVAVSSKAHFLGHAEAVDHGDATAAGSGGQVFDYSPPGSDISGPAAADVLAAVSAGTPSGRRKARKSRSRRQLVPDAIA